MTEIRSLVVPASGEPFVETVARGPVLLERDGARFRLVAVDFEGRRYQVFVPVDAPTPPTQARLVPAFAHLLDSTGPGRT